jgi:hypothetical protein
MNKNQQSKFNVVLLFLFTFWISSCSDKAKYSEIPAIGFKSYEIIEDGDSIRFTITFIDGDGDLGLSQDDTLPPFDSKSEYFYNLFIEYYEFINEDFRKITPHIFSEDTIRFYYRFQNITPEGNTKAIRGEIKATLPLQPVYSNKIKFEMYLVDRALNKSNIVWSPEIDITP